MSAHLLDRQSKGSLELAIPTTGMAEFVKRLASQHHITAERIYADAWGDAVTRMAGDDVTLDQTQRLLVSLQRAHKITPIQMLTIFARYLQEKKATARVRSV